MTPAAIKSRPILFSGPMVRAILDGRKSQTRRIVKNGGPCAVDPRFHPAEDVARELAQDLRSLAKRCPYGAPGDELFVREAFASFDNVGQPVKPSDATYVVMRDGTQVYRDGVIVPRLAEYAPGASDHIKWRPSIFLPRWASRLTLVVKSVRVERLGAITRDDAIAEGFPGTFGTEELEGLTPADEYIVAFRAMNKLAADADPWVWVIEFERKQGGAA